LTTRPRRFKWRNVFAVLGVLALALVVYANRHQFSSFWHIMKTLRWYVIVLIVFVQVGSYWVNGLYYRSILRIFTYDVGIKRLFEGALATNFVNYVVPTAGLAGAGFLSQVLAPEVPRGESVLTQLMRYALSALAVLVMMPVGFLIIFLSNDAGHTVVKVTLGSSALIIIFALCVVTLVSRESALRRTVDWLMRVLKRLFKRFSSEEKVRHFVDEFYIGWHAMTVNKRRMLVPFGWSIVYIMIEIGTFWLAFLAFGKVENLGIVIMAYLFANIASTFGGVFFSTGTFELGMAGTLVALGSPLAFAFSVTVVYRVVNLVIALPPGFVYYRKYLPNSPAPDPATSAGTS
jgi:uncharacterized protein (TIRG00374 family)